MPGNLDISKQSQFWSRFYRQNSVPFPPSSFARAVLPFLVPNQSLCELGCGNGRDSIFFARHKIRVDAFDLVQDEISYLQKNYSDPFIRFTCDDFSRLPLERLKYDAIYSRFTIHSVSEEMENSVLQWSYSSLKKGGYLFVESRSIHDSLLNRGTRLGRNENFTDHYRRYMDMDLFCDKLNKIGFNIVSAQESDTFAVTDSESPMIVRVIANV
ncbi:MAG: class I SAM-dependent methyltransferase [Lentisphaeria bacterium]|nr:class I SAM-dependent methyltransferase [Lentisphaeria bacterium]